MSKVFFNSLFLTLISCAGMPPVQEYNLARTALHAAKKFKASQYAPKSYRKALYSYKKGQKAFENRFYGQAREYFEQCVEEAEKSENITRWIRYKKRDHSL